MAWNHPNGPPPSVDPAAPTTGVDAGPPPGTSLERYDYTCAAECRSIFIAVGCGMAQNDPATRRFLYVNPAFCRQTGRSAEELYGLTFSDITHPDDRPQDDILFSRLLAGEVDGYTARKRYLRPDGSVLWVQVIVSLLRDEAGRPWRSISVVQEIADLKRIEEQLLAANQQLRVDEEFFRRLAEVSTFGLIVCDVHGGVSFANQTFLDMLGYAPEDAGRLNWIDWTPPDQRDLDRRSIEMTRHTGVAPPYEKELYAKDGRRVPVLLSFALLKRDADGEPVVACFVTDLTQRKEAEAAIEHQKQVFQRLAENSPDVIARYDRQLRHLYVNPATKPVTGLEPEQFIGKTTDEVGLPPYDCARWNEHVRKVFTTGERVEFEFVLERQGHSQHFAVIAVPEFDAKGRVETVLSLARDVTEMKRVQEQVRQNEEQFRTILEALPQMVWTIKADGQHDFCNHQWHHYTGLTLEQTNHDGWATAMHPDDAAPALAAWHRAVGTGQPLESEGRLRRAADGAYRWHHTLIVPIRDAQNQIVKWVGTADDIHEWRLAQDAQHAANQRLSEADRRKDEFLAMLAHELRNPLAPIRNAIEIMQRGHPDEHSVARQRDIIDRQVNHMARLLDDLLDVSRITRGNVVLKKQTVRLLDVLARAVETASPLVEARHQTLTYTPPAPDLQVSGDFDRLIQIVGNLLNNAAKYTEEGGRIWLAAEREAGEAVIRVRDNGIGIAPEMLHSIFDVFTQAERSLDRAQGGLGLGLTLVRNLSQMHGGRVDALSAGLGQGSEFVVHLPALSEAQIAPALEPCVPAPAVAAPRRILVVDDVVDTADSLSELLGLLGHQVWTAYDGPGALRGAREYKPEIVLLDIGLPGMDGFEVARQIRRDDALKGMMLVALTGYSQEEDRRKAQAAGFDRIFTKPVELTALLDLFSSEDHERLYGTG